jgi:antitoxin (DNA-binding transcriptional repressor) of toxin-antitoxin stability system
VSGQSGSGEGPSERIVGQGRSGEEVIITCHGRVVAHIHRVSRPKHPLMLDDLAAFRATMPPLWRPSAELLREVRDEGL